MAYELIIFDCDGTLVDSETVNNIGCSEALMRAGLTQYTPERVRRDFMGMSQKAIFEKIEKENGLKLPPTMMQDFIERVAYHQNRGELHAAPHAREVIAYCREHGKICVASNGETENVEAALAITGLRPLFPPQGVFTARMVARPKPAPDLFLHAARMMDAAPARTLVIEDSVAGVTAGVAAGMRTIGFTGLYHDPVRQEKALLQAGAYAVIKDLQDVIKIIEQQGTDNGRDHDQGLRS